LLGIECFQAVASQTPFGPDRVEVVSDAQQDKVYHQPFSREGNGWRPVAPLKIRTFTEWLADIPTHAWVSGPGLIKWASQLPSTISRVPPDLWDPQPQTLLALGWGRLRGGDRDDPFALEPLYLRPSSAEEQWKAQKE
jgi:tRNA A37 threonylcarbamoyladenosine modification protein TsaB